MTKQEIENAARAVGLSYDEHVSLPKYPPMPPHIAEERGLPENYQSIGRRVLGRISGPWIDPMQMVVDVDTGSVEGARAALWIRAQEALAALAALHTTTLAPTQEEP